MADTLSPGEGRGKGGGMACPHGAAARKKSWGKKGGHGDRGKGVADQELAGLDCGMARQ